MKNSQLELIVEQKKKKISREAYINKQFEKSNKGSLSQEGIKKLAAMIENGNVRYESFPTWVLDSYLDGSKLGAIPLKNNKWLDVHALVNTSNEVEGNEITYAGFVVDSQRNKESSVKTLNIVRSEEVDAKKYAGLLLFKRAANEARKVIETKNNRERIESSQQQEAGGVDMNNPAGTTPTTPTTDLSGTSTGATTDDAGVTDISNATPPSDTGDTSRIDITTGLEKPPKH